MAGLPQFPISTQTDPYWEIPMYDAAGNPLSIEGRVFEAWIAPAQTKQGVAEPVKEIKVLTFQDGMTLVPPTDGVGDQSIKNTLVHQVSREFAQANFPRGELTADLLEVVDGARRLFSPVRLFYLDPAQIREYVADRAGITFGQGRQPIVTPVAIAGQAGRRGAGFITGTLAPQPSDGEDGDYFVVEREGQANLVYGPKENGEWPPQPSSTFGVKSVADIPDAGDAAKLGVATEQEAAAGQSDKVVLTPANGKAFLTANAVAGIPDVLKPFIPAPPSVLAPGSIYPISWFADGAIQMLRNPSARDLRATFTAAVQSGQRVGFPAELYPIRSGQVLLDADTPIHWDAANGATIIAGANLPTGISGCLIQVKAKNMPSTRNRIPLTMRGFRWDATEITAARGKGSGSGLGFLDWSWYTQPIIEDMVAFCGRTPIDASDAIGIGYIDTAFGSHGVLGGVYRNIYVEGAYDLAGYWSGSQVRRTVTNPFVTVAGSPVVQVNFPAHGYSSGQSTGVVGGTAVGGITLAGGYVVAVLNADTFTITHSANATSGASGGGSVTFHNDVADEMGDLDGEQELCENWTAYRCNNVLSSKRNFQNTLMKNIYAVECGNGVRCANIGGPTFGGRLIVRDSWFRKITGQPIVLVGPNCSAINNDIQDYGSALDGSARTAHSINTIIAGISLVSAKNAIVKDNKIRQTGLWKSGSSVPEDAGKERRAIAITKSAEYSYGTEWSKIHNNHFEGVYQGVYEGAGCDYNRAYDNTEVGTAVASAKSGASSIVGGKPLVVADNGTIPAVTTDPAAHPQPASYSGAATTTSATWSSRATATSGRTHAAISDPNGILWRLVTSNGETYVQSGPAGSLSNGLIFGADGLRTAQNFRPNADGAAVSGSATFRWASTYSLNYYVGTANNRHTSATAAPTTGAYKRGDYVKNSTPAVGQPKGWYCTADGSPGTWVSEGNL